jgi:Tfp pilus assembly protein PilO
MKLNTREQVLAAGAGLAVFVVINYFLAGPALDKWREMGDQNLKIKADIAEAKMLIAREPQLQADYNRATTRLRESSVGQSAGDVIGRIEQLGGQHGVTFTQRTPSDPVEKQRYVEKQAQFTFNTQWPNLVKFLFALSRQTEVYRVSNLRLRADTKDPTNLRGDMAVVNYYQRTTAPTRTGGAPAAKNPVDKPVGSGEDKPASP